MENNRKWYRTEAKRLLTGRYTNPIVVYLIYEIVIAILMGLYMKNMGPLNMMGSLTYFNSGNRFVGALLNLGEFFVGVALAYATFYMTIKIVKSIEFSIEEAIVVPFKEQYGRNIILQFLVSLFTFLWTLLFIIPGIIKSYSYSMSFYIVNKKPELDATSALNLSKDLTKGHKTDLFLLDLSYIGWILLGILTFGILLLWVMPRLMTAKTLLFEEIYNGNKGSQVNPEDSKNTYDVMNEL